LHNYLYYHAHVIKMNANNDDAHRDRHNLFYAQDMNGPMLIPPPWSPANHANYTFRAWFEDVGRWSIATELPAEEQSAAVILGLNDTCDEIDTHILTNGTFEEVGVPLVFVTGLEFLMRRLSRKYAPPAAKRSVDALNDIMTFGHRGGENVNELISRFDILKQRVRGATGLDPGPSGFAWMLLIGMRIPTDEWPSLLVPFQGVLPGTEHELEQLIQVIRRSYNHLRWNNEAAVVPATPGNSASSAIPAADTQDDPHVVTQQLLSRWPEG
jgi:hypothetical protein